MRGKAARRQEKGEARSGTTGEPFDEPTTQKAPAPKGVAFRRAPAVSPRSTVLPIRSSRGSWRIASPERNADESIWSQLALNNVAARERRTLGVPHLAAM
jgi:hypothetical protein